MKLPDNKFAIILRGYAGAGKTTLARNLAKRLQLKSLSTDYFLFALYPYEEHRSAKEVVLALEDLLCAMQNGFNADKSFVIEGDASPIMGIDRMEKIVETLEAASYKIVWIKMIIDDDEVLNRMKQRDRVVDQADMQRLKEGLDAQPKDNEIVIDTTEREPEETFAVALEQLGIE